MTTNLRDKPEVIAIAGELGLEEYAVVGMLHHFWCWADANTVDGNACGVTKAWLDRYVQRHGFADVLEKYGWLRVHEHGLRIPKFDVHMGKSAKKRALGKRRSQKHRNASTVTKALPEKETEEREKSTAKTPPYPPDFVQFWAVYPRRVGKGRALKAWKRVGAAAHIEAILEHVKADVVAWQHRDVSKKPHPSTWLNDRRWEDPLSEPEGKDNGDPIRRGKQTQEEKRDAIRAGLDLEAGRIRDGDVSSCRGLPRATSDAEDERHILPYPEE